MTTLALKALLVFNVLDAVFTLIVTQSGIGYEVNPFMAYLLDIGPMAFMVYKILSGMLAVFVFALLIPNRLAVFGTYLATGAYACVCLFHTAAFTYYLA